MADYDKATLATVYTLGKFLQTGWVARKGFKTLGYKQQQIKQCCVYQTSNDNDKKSHSPTTLFPAEKEMVVLA